MNHSPEKIREAWGALENLRARVELDHHAVVREVLRLSTEIDQLAAGGLDVGRRLILRVSAERQRDELAAELTAIAVALDALFAAWRAKAPTKEDAIARTMVGPKEKAK